MSSEGLVAGMLILAVLVAWVGSPLLRRRKRLNSDENLLQKQRERLLMVYERVLNNVRDLDEDHSTGKMPTDDYHSERELWVQRGIQVLKSLDQLDASNVLTSSVQVDDIDQAIDQKIEDAIAAYRAKVNS